MPRKPKQTTLITPAGKDPSNYAGTQEAKDKMARVRAMRGQTPPAMPVQTAPVQNPMLAAIEHMKALADMGAMLKASGLTGNLTEMQVVTLLVKGLELGVGPVEAVQSLYFTNDGKIEANSELMRALVGRSGVGFIRITNYTDEIVSVVATRYGQGGRPDVSQEFTYTIHDAQRAGLFDDKWRKWPRAMCLARVTSESCRAVFPDVLLGASYAPGEIGGEPKVEHPAAEELPARQGAEPATSDLGELAETPPFPPTSVAETPPQTAPEPRTAPERAMPTPPAVPRETEAPEGVLVTGPNGGSAPPGLDSQSPPPAQVAPPATGALPELVHKFPADAPGGGLRIVQTAGIRKEQLQRIGDLTTPRAGQPNWQELQVVARKWLAQLGLPDLKYLADLQGETLIRMLEEHTATKQPPPPAASEHDKLLDTILRETATQHLREKVVQVLVRSAKVQQLGEIKIPDLKSLLAQIRTMVTDPQVFGHMLDQLLADNPSVV